MRQLLQVQLHEDAVLREPPTPASSLGRADHAQSCSTIQALLQAESRESTAAARLDAEIAAVAEEIAAHEISLEIAALEATLQGKIPREGTWADLEQRVSRSEERARIAEVSAARSFRAA
jgi:hypothetical protein